MQPRTTTEFLDAIKAKFSLRSEYALVKHLGVTQVTVIRWRTGGCMNDAHAIKVADILGLQRAYVLACTRLEKAKDTESSGTWRQIADTFATPVMLPAVILSLVFGLFSLNLAHADETFGAANNIHYAKPPCRPYIEMSYFSRIKMSYPRGYWKDGRDYKRTDLYEPQRADPP